MSMHMSMHMSMMSMCMPYMCQLNAVAIRHQAKRVDMCIEV